MAQKKRLKFNRPLVILFGLLLAVIAIMLILIDAIVRHNTDASAMHWISSSGILVAAATSLLTGVVLIAGQAVLDPESIAYRLTYRRAVPMVKSAVSLMRPQTSEKDELIAEAIASTAQYHANLRGDPIVRDWRLDYKISEIGSSAPAGPSDFVRVDAMLEYSRRRLPRDFRIMGKINDYRDKENILQDPQFEFVWEILTGDYRREDIPSEPLRKYFAVTNVRINKQNMKVEPQIISADDPEIIFHVRVDENIINNSDENQEFPYFIEIQFQALHARNYNCIAANVKYITNRFLVSLDYSHVAKIRNVYQMSHVVGDALATADKRKRCFADTFIMRA